MEEDLDTRPQPVIDYLSKVGSTKYSIDEYKYTWRYTEIYPKTSKEMFDLLLDPKSPHYWKGIWEANNSFLVKGKKIPSPVPLEAFWGEKAKIKTRGDD